MPHAPAPWIIEEVERARRERRERPQPRLELPLPAPPVQERHEVPPFRRGVVVVIETSCQGQRLAQGCGRQLPDTELR